MPHCDLLSDWPHVASQAQTHIFTFSRLQILHKNCSVSSTHATPRYQHEREVTAAAILLHLQAMSITAIAVVFIAAVKCVDEALHLKLW